MGKVTFVVDFEDGEEPMVSVATEILGGRLSSVLWDDYRDDFFTEEQVDMVRSAFDDTAPTEEEELVQEEIIQKMELMTL
ncbi:hypothetical protein LVO39_004790 [Salmonella enterica]|uniref:Uncharacterized protein n=1 Tax=Salmonella newport TaxID=108619 RepID=A0A5X8Y2E1_SALNE|nr:hypothetical protein [Salmonella enterica]EBP3855394.1 hypothetical protein [Salmonella enterica subsp. enterica]EBV0463044.1 hypothetical protein [Salmonella enterica subsp. enterica serovar Newport]EBW2994396.1 hypothetical protein [Salmonella enterica subsp. enterica serovar Oslo]EBW8392032.1 hypothetical protein [Salmonella enterica subsp. enterica serovar Florida]EDH8624430.1 hypothetical protein [Salmonella enterica subsp. enterica serovar Typhimurium]EKR2481277.1 hypothetical protei